MKNKKKTILIISTILLILVISIILLVIFKTKKEKNVEYLCSLSGNTDDFKVTEEIRIIRKDGIVSKIVSSKLNYTNMEKYLDEKKYTSNDKIFDDENMTISISQKEEKLEKKIEKYIKELKTDGYTCTIK